MIEADVDLTAHVTAAVIQGCHTQTAIVRRVRSSLDVSARLVRWRLADLVAVGSILRFEDDNGRTSYFVHT